MEKDEIGVVLARAYQLRSKLNNCIIEKASAEEEEDEGDSDISQQNNKKNVVMSDAGTNTVLLKVNLEEQRRWRWRESGDTEAESLIKIRDALESLEEQLACLQGLQQRQCLEREATLAEIDESRRILIKKLKEYRGTDLEVIQETCAFAGESVVQRDSILLPPYEPQVPNSFMSSVDDYSPTQPSAHSVRRRNVSARQPFVNGDERQENEHSNDCDERKEISTQGINNGSVKRIASGIGHIIGLTTKACLVVASVIAVFTLANFDPKLRRSASPKTLDQLPKRLEIPALQATKDVPKCPPGKVLLIEDGVPRCFVKERVEVPFEPVIKVPDVSYGCG